MMHRTLAIVGALLIGIPAVSAQTAVEALPQGSAIAGWAVEAIPVPQMEARSSRPPPPGGRWPDASAPSHSSIAEYAGQTGLVRKSVDPNAFVSNQFERFAGDRQQLVFNGRAFFRAQQPQQYVFVASALASSPRFQENCEVVMIVGGKTIIARSFRSTSSRMYDVSPSRATGPTLVSGNISLQPGFYPVEFVVGCPRANYDVPVEVRFQIREERDAEPRGFANGELFHIRR